MDAIDLNYIENKNDRARGIHQSTKSLLYKHEEPIWSPEPTQTAGHGGIYLWSQPWADGDWQISGAHWPHCQWGTPFQKQNQTSPRQMTLEEAWHLRLSFDLNMHKHLCVPAHVSSPNTHKQKRQIFKRWQIQVIVKSKICFPKLWYRQRCIGWILASPNLYRSLI